MFPSGLKIVFHRKLYTCGLGSTSAVLGREYLQSTAETPSLQLVWNGLATRCPSVASLRDVINRLLLQNKLQRDGQFRRQSMKDERRPERCQRLALRSQCTTDFGLNRNQCLRDFGHAGHLEHQLRELGGKMQVIAFALRTLLAAPYISIQMPLSWRSSHKIFSMSPRTTTKCHPRLPL